MFAAEKESIFAPSKLWLMAVLGIILGCGLGARLYDLKDPPLDYASTRQLRSALLARSKYYSIAQDPVPWKQDMAQKQGSFSQIEPEVMEWIVAITYRVEGGEHVWIARIYSSLFWVVGGVALFALSREMVGVDGAVIGLVYTLFAPFGVIASRSFQPDPLMTAAIMASWWTFYRWHKSHAWKWAILAGISAGVAMFVKSTSVFFLLGGMAVLVFLRNNLRKNLRDKQMWAIVFLAGIPVLVYHIYGIFIVGTLGQQFQGRFFPQLLTELGFYRQLINAVGTVMGHKLLLLPGLLGILLFRKKQKIGFVLGIWGGYILYVLAFSYHSTTHYYYHLPAIPLMGLALASFSDFVIKKFNSPVFNAVVIIGLAAIVLLGVGGTHYRLYQEDYRHEPGWYWMVAGKVDREAKIAVLSQDYGNRIAYYGWIKPKVWIGSRGDYGELTGKASDPFEEKFNQFFEHMDYFIVTRMNSLERQERLHKKLQETYQIHDQGGGYVIYDLRAADDE